MLTKELERFIAKICPGLIEPFRLDIGQHVVVPTGHGPDGDVGAVGVQLGGEDRALLVRHGFVLVAMHEQERWRTPPDVGDRAGQPGQVEVFTGRSTK